MPDPHQGYHSQSWVLLQVLQKPWNTLLPNSYYYNLYIYGIQVGEPRGFEIPHSLWQIAYWPIDSSTCEKPWFFISCTLLTVWQGVSYQDPNAWLAARSSRRTRPLHCQEVAWLEDDRTFFLLAMKSAAAAPGMKVPRYTSNQKNLISHESKGETATHNIIWTSNKRLEITMFRRLVYWLSNTAHQANIPLSYQVPLADEGLLGEEHWHHPH